MCVSLSGYSIASGFLTSRTTKGNRKNFNNYYLIEKTDFLITSPRHTNFTQIGRVSRSIINLFLYL